MTTHDAVEPPTQGLVDLALDELRQRITTLEIELAHWERTFRVLSADLRAIAPERCHCPARSTAYGDGGRSR